MRKVIQSANGRDIAVEVSQRKDGSYGQIMGYTVSICDLEDESYFTALKIGFAKALLFQDDREIDCEDILWKEVRILLESEELFEEDEHFILYSETKREVGKDFNLGD